MTRHGRLAAIIVLLVSATGGATRAQIFFDRPGLLPGPEIWSEAVLPLDADGDGRLDILFVNANGWRKPGDMQAPSADPLLPTLLLQVDPPAGEKAPAFRDATAEFLPKDLLLHGKSVAAGDFDGDGLGDLAIAVAFGARPRLLLRRLGPTRFVDAPEALPDLKLNSNGVGAGDFDDDGDLDLVFADAGPNSDRPPGGLLRLFLNDGRGRFVDASERLGAVPKIGAQNPKVVDVDGDLDLDIVLDGKSAVTQLYLNDGAARFTLHLDMIPECEGQPYEIEWGDLDGDLDLDAVFMNFTGTKRVKYQNIVLRNLSSETGRLGFEPIVDALKGRNLEDQNDFALADFDDDGDFDLLVASLMGPPIEEKLFVNAGALGPASFVQKDGAFPKIFDGSLDLTVADFDGDGRLDVVTAEGESRGAEGFRNRYYEGRGAIDSRPPRIARTTRPIEKEKRYLCVLAQIVDASSDDGVDFIVAELCSQREGAPEVSRTAMKPVGGGIFRGAVEVRPESKAPDRLWIEARDRAGHRTVSGALR